ncbi:unnamed protein product, partial [Porites evermanni]
RNSSRVLLWFLAISTCTESSFVDYVLHRSYNMKSLTVAVLAISVIVLLLHDVDARGGGRGGSSRGSSRGGWSSGSKGSRGSSRTSSSRRGGSSLKLKITKTTPIKPVKFCTPVIKSQ